MQSRSPLDRAIKEFKDTEDNFSNIAGKMLLAIDLLRREELGGVIKITEIEQEILHKTSFYFQILYDTREFINNLFDADNQPKPDFLTNYIQYYEDPARNTDFALRINACIWLSRHYTENYAFFTRIFPEANSTLTPAELIQINEEDRNKIRILLHPNGFFPTFIKPIQRLAQYGLFAETWTKESDLGSENRIKADIICKKFKSLCQFGNAAIRQDQMTSCETPERSVMLLAMVRDKFGETNFNSNTLDKEEEELWGKPIPSRTSPQSGMPQQNTTIFEGSSLTFKAEQQAEIRSDLADTKLLLQNTDNLIKQISKNKKTFIEEQIKTAENAWAKNCDTYLSNDSVCEKSKSILRKLKSEVKETFIIFRANTDDVSYKKYFRLIELFNQFMICNENEDPYNKNRLIQHINELDEPYKGLSTKAGIAYIAISLSLIALTCGTFIPFLSATAIPIFIIAIGSVLAAITVSTIIKGIYDTVKANRIDKDTGFYSINESNRCQFFPTEEIKVLFNDPAIVPKLAL